MLPVTRCNSLPCLAALLVLLTASTAVLAQPDSIEGCKAITEREARYACYDAVEAQALDDFGKSPARLETGDAGEVALVDRVAGLKEVQFKQWQITLEGGQVWRQQLSQTLNLKEGYEVRITAINGGPNHRLSSPQVAGSIQVRRVR
jgi:hypothetical protein